MAVKTKKSVKETSLRTPKAKSKLGLSVPRIGMPHGEFVRGDSEKRADLDTVIGVSGQGGQTESSAVSGLSSESGESRETEWSGQTGTPRQSRQTSMTRQTADNIPATPPPTKQGSNAKPAATSIAPSLNGSKAGSSDDLTELEPPAIPAPTAQPAQSSLSTLTGQASYAPLGTTESRTFATVAAEIPLTIAPAFRGKSAQLFDVIYSLTLGAPVPQRTARIRKGELMRLAGIGSRNTFTANLDFLINSGLVAQTVIAGESDGNEFEILQVPAMTGQTGQTTHTSQPLTMNRLEHAAKPDHLQAFIDTLETASIRLTGKSLTDADWAAFSQLAEIVINAAIKDPRLGQPGASLVAIAVEKLADS